MRNTACLILYYPVCFQCIILILSDVNSTESEFTSVGRRSRGGLREFDHLSEMDYAVDVLYPWENDFGVHTKTVTKGICPLFSLLQPR